MRSSILMLSAAILAAVLFAGRPTVRSEEAEREQAAVVIECLLDHISGSKSVFIRNGKQYTSEQAAGHIRKKYEHFREDIETPEDFIRLAATKSIMSGKPYLVRLPDGREMLCADWLTEELAACRADSLGMTEVVPDSSDLSD